MMDKTLLKCLLISGLALAITYPALNAFAQKGPAQNPVEHKVIAYYFHTNTR